MTDKLLMVVAAALIDESGRVLVQQRPAGKPMADLWEFPGGKLEPDEAPELALVRELLEELSIAVDPAALVPLSFASAPLGHRHLLLLLYVCREWSGAIRATESPAVQWCDAGALAGLDMPPADVPLVAALERYLSGRVPNR